MVKPDEEVDVFDESTPFVYIFVRDDIPRIQQVIQTSHAAHEAGIQFGKVDDKISHFCIFGVKNEEQLTAIAWQMDQGGIEYNIFHEPDFEMGYSALATKPLQGEARQFFKKYRLLK